VMAKCPSKYEAGKVTAKVVDPGVAAK